MEEKELKKIETKELMKNILPLVKEGKRVKIRVKGISMSPLIRDNRDFITLSPLNDRKLKVGDIILFKRVDGKYILHRLYSIDDGLYSFVGDNQITVERGITKEQLQAYADNIERDGKPLKAPKTVNFIMTRWMKFRVKHPERAEKVMDLLVKIKHCGKNSHRQ